MKVLLNLIWINKQMIAADLKANKIQISSKKEIIAMIAYI
jgi:hypothetical protein